MNLRAFFAIAVGGAPWFAGLLGHCVGHDTQTILRASAMVCLALWTPTMVLVAVTWPKEAA